MRKNRYLLTPLNVFWQLEDLKNSLHKYLPPQNSFDRGKEIITKETEDAFLAFKRTLLQNLQDIEREQ